MGSENEARGRPPQKTYMPNDVLRMYNVDLGSRSKWTELRSTNPIVTEFLAPMRLSMLSDQSPNHFVQLAIAEWRFIIQLQGYTKVVGEKAKEGLTKADKVIEAREVLESIRRIRRDIGTEVLGEEQEEYARRIKEALSKTGVTAKQQRDALVNELKAKFFPPGTEPEDKKTIPPAKTVKLRPQPVPPSPPKLEPTKVPQERVTKSEFEYAKKELSHLIEEKQKFLFNLAFGARDTAIAVYEHATGKKERMLYLSPDRYRVASNQQVDTITVVGFLMEDYRSGRGEDAKTEKINYRLFTQDLQQSEHPKEHTLESEGYTLSAWVSAQEGFSASLIENNRTRWFTKKQPYKSIEDLGNDYALVHMGDIIRGLTVVALLNGMARECGVSERIDFPDNTIEVWEKWKAYADPQDIKKFETYLNKLEKFFTS